MKIELENELEDELEDGLEDELEDEDALALDYWYSEVLCNYQGDEADEIYDGLDI